MAEHTPGPWITDTSHWQDREGVTIWAESNIIADVVPDHHNQEEANARLIAAAPTMREALVDLIEQIEAYERLHGANTCAIDPDGARAAIAKAEGWLVCQDGQHRCFNTDQPCGCQCDDCRDDTEPRCDVCNQLINTQGQCEDDPSHYQRVRE